MEEQTKTRRPRKRKFSGEVIDLSNYLGTELHQWVREDVAVRVHEVVHSAAALALLRGAAAPLPSREAAARALLSMEAEEWVYCPSLSCHNDGLDEVYLGLAAYELRLLAGQMPEPFTGPFRVEG